MKKILRIIIPFLFFFAVILTILLVIKPGASIFHFKQRLNSEVLRPDEGYVYRLKGELIKGPFIILDGWAIVIGGLDVWATVTDEGSGIDNDTVKFYVNDGPKTLMQYSPPKYVGLWYFNNVYFLAALKVEAKDKAGNRGSDQRKILFAIDIL